MVLIYNPNLKQPSRKLRKNMTKAEVFLWTILRNKQLVGLQFYRQKAIGNFIVDFYCPKAKLIIEIDGAQHYEPEGKIKDEGRDKYLNKLGLRVLRFYNTDVLKNIDSVIGKINSFLMV